jgi:hypothetical protein
MVISNVYQNTNCVFPMEGQNEKLHKQEKLPIDKERHIDLHNIK